MKLSGYILLIILILPISLFSQTDKGQQVDRDTSGLLINRIETGAISGKVKVVQDPKLTRILRKHVELNRTTGIQGWRILIYRGREMSKANQNKADFEQNFGHLKLPVTVEYNEPDFSTMVGSFRTKEDAFRFKQTVSVRFPQAYLVPARIKVD
jgi:hypothetical protein